jgi:hypothetical protein
MRWQVIVRYVYKIERNSFRSRFYVIRKFLPHDQLLTFHIEDSSLGLVSKLLSYPAAQAACARLNRTPSQVNAPELGDIGSVSSPVASSVAIAS